MCFQSLWACSRVFVWSGLWLVRTSSLHVCIAVGLLGADVAGVGGRWRLLVLNSTSGALETITFGDAQAVTMKTSMIKAVDLSSKELGTSGAIIVAAFLPKCQ